MDFDVLGRSLCHVVQDFNVFYGQMMERNDGGKKTTAAHDDKRCTGGNVFFFCITSPYVLLPMEQCVLH